jgi:hypothetical protein
MIGLLEIGELEPHLPGIRLYWRLRLIKQVERILDCLWNAKKEQPDANQLANLQSAHSQGPRCARLNEKIAPDPDR